MQLVVGRVGRAHGLRGEVSVEVRTDDPQRRFAPGSVLGAEPAPAAAQPGEPILGGSLTVAAARWHSGRLLVSFEGVDDRGDAEALRGTVLLVDVPDGEVPADPDEFYDHQLIGLAVRTVGGDELGRVADVLHLPGQDVLAVARPAGNEVLLPFVAEIVPQVDLPGGRVVVAPPEGLVEPAESAGPVAPAGPAQSAPPA